MRHRLQQKVFDGGGNRSSSPQKSRTSSTFTTNSSGNPHSAKKNKLHSKSTYFYNDGSSSGDVSGSSLASFQRHPVGLCLLRANCKSQDTYLRNAHPAQPGNDVLWKDGRRKNLGKISRLSYVVPSVCTLALLIGGIIAIRPILSGTNKVYAEGEDGVMPMANDSIVRLTITPNAADSTNNNVIIGEPAYFSNIIEVGGSNITSYSLTLNTADGGNGKLIGEKNAYATVDKVNNNTLPAAFPDNTWGFAVSDTVSVDKANMSYNPVPPEKDNSNSSQLAFRTNLSGEINDDYKLVFAAKLGADMPADHYKADVYISVVGNAAAVANLGFTGGGKTISTMQAMTSEICNGAAANAIGRLYDVRDNELYWVAKLADNNCWMTQNLDYDGGGNKVTSPSTWSNYSAAYYDPGNYVYNGANGPNGNCSNSTGLADCSQQFSTVTASSNLHYHVGNYYSWDAAINGVCPSGWQLPVYQNGKSFASLLSRYGMSNMNTVNLDKIHISPLYFTYSGSVQNNQLYSAGRSGEYWTSTPYSSNNAAYFLDFGAGSFYTGNYSGYRSYGYSVRCVAQ